MGTAEQENLHSMLINQGQHINKQQQCIQVTEEKLMQLANVPSQASTPHFSQTHSVITSSLIARPDKFTSEATQCWGFLLQCSMYFTVQERASDQDKVAQFISLLTGKAIHWATTLWEWNHRASLAYIQFAAMFHHVFDHAPEGNEIGGSQGS